MGGRRKLLKGRILTQSGKINEMLKFHPNYVIAKEEMIQFDDNFERTTEVYKEMQGLPRLRLSSIV